MVLLGVGRQAIPEWSCRHEAVFRPYRTIRFRITVTRLENPFDREPRCREDSVAMVRGDQ
jgi:hypothetical protein